MKVHILHVYLEKCISNTRCKLCLCNSCMNKFGEIVTYSEDVTIPLSRSWMYRPTNQYLSDTKVTLQALDSTLEQLKLLFYQFFDSSHMFQSANNNNKCQN